MEQPQQDDDEYMEVHHPNCPQASLSLLHHLLEGIGQYTAKKPHGNLGTYHGLVR